MCIMIKSKINRMCTCANISLQNKTFCAFSSFCCQYVSLRTGPIPDGTLRMAPVRSMVSKQHK